jgi:hypothetical protein
MSDSQYQMDTEMRLNLRSKLAETLVALKTALRDGRPEAFLPVEEGLKTALALLGKESETGLESSELTGFRIVFGKGLASPAGIGANYDPTLVGLAMALDDCEDMIVEERGLYGDSGFGGAWVEACYDEDPLDKNVKVVPVTGLWDIPDLEFGDIFEAKWFRDKQRNGTVRAGDHRVLRCTSHIDQLLPQKRYP